MVTIEIATKTDIEDLTKVEVESKLQSFPEYMDAIEIDFDIRFYRWQTHFNAQSPVSAKPERTILKAVKDGKLIGFIAGHLTNRYDKDAEIQNFYVLKEEQHNGVGISLLKNLVDWLRQHQVKSLCVGIFPENPYKIFYLKYGGKYLNPHWIYWDDLSVF